MGKLYHRQLKSERTKTSNLIKNADLGQEVKNSLCRDVIKNVLQGVKIVKMSFSHRNDVLTLGEYMLNRIDMVTDLTPGRVTIAEQERMSKICMANKEVKCDW